MNKILTDQTVLDQYIDLFEDEATEFITDIIDTFLNDAPKQFAELDQSLSENDSVTFRRAAHTLKSGCKTVGAPSLAEKFQALEDIGDKGDLSTVDSTLLECKTLFEVLKTELYTKKMGLV